MSMHYTCREWSRQIPMVESDDLGGFLDQLGLEDVHLGGTVHDLGAGLR